MSLLRVNEAQRSEESLEYPVTNEIRRDFSLLSCPELVEGLKMTCLRKSYKYSPVYRLLSTVYFF
jgi:hypothetical protein